MMIAIAPQTLDRLSNEIMFKCRTMYIHYRTFTLAIFKLKALHVFCIFNDQMYVTFSLLLLHLSSKCPFEFTSFLQTWIEFSRVGVTRKNLS